MIVNGLNGNRYSIGERLGGGGEGDIYTITDDIYHTVKIYKNPTPDHEEKLKSMIQSTLRDSDLLSWPLDVVYDVSGNFSGYVMKRIHGGVPISAIYAYGSKSNQTDLPWSYRIIIAINLCIALDAVQGANQIIGDFNPNNMFINLKSGHVKLLDTDSYHIQSATKTFRCTVSLPNYLAPEIAGKMKKGDTLSSIPLPTFTKYSDNFALAIHIFQLLMNGAHPYQGALKPGTPQDVNLPNIRDNILAGAVPHINPGSEYITTPSYSPRFDWLPQTIQTLFKQAFVTGTRSPCSRPGPKEWYNALANYHFQLVGCSSNPTHSYYRMAPQCPLCLAEQNYLRALGRPVQTPNRISTSKAHLPQSHTPTNNYSLQSNAFNNYSTTNHTPAYYSTSRVVDDPNYMEPWSDLLSVASKILREIEPIEERYLLELCKKMLGVERLSAEMRKTWIGQLRGRFTYKCEGNYNSYASNSSVFHSFTKFRSPRSGSFTPKISYVCILDIKNAVLYTLETNRSLDVDQVTSLVSKNLGYARPGKKIQAHVEDAINILLKERRITSVYGNYQLR